jgi:maltooligosyltrehalose trehalohydrolase
MREFAVWAPAAGQVELRLAEGGIAMEPGPGGWWRGAVEGAGRGTRYGFSLDAGPVRPDPRSGFQPEGVDGLSELVDHDSFAWNDGDWRGLSIRGAVLYELHVGTFTPEGTFEAVIARLGHLAELGIDAIELMPVVEFAGERGWGYDGVDLFAPHHAYGGPAGLKRLVDACHAVGIGVVIDVVYNHLGPAGNYLAEFGPYFSERHQTNWGAAVNFDGPGSDEVRRFVIANALMWLRDYHADGLRLDAVHAIVDDSARHVLEELADDVDALATALGRPLFLIAESDLNDPRFVRSRDAGGYGLDAAWADEWHHALHAVLAGERSGYYADFGSLTLLGKALRQAWVYDGTWSPHRQRHHGRSPAGMPGYRFVVCTQNHDQVGNRAIGERSSALMSDGRLRVAAALLLTAPFTPMLFQGEEWGATSPFQYFTDHDPELGEAVSEGRRNEFAAFGWDPAELPDPQATRTFEASRLVWEELDQPVHAGLLAWHRELLSLRRRIHALSDPRLSRVGVSTDEASGTLSVARGPVTVLVNLGEGDHRFALHGVTTILAASDPRVRGSAGTITVPADAAAIVETADG